MTSLLKGLAYTLLTLTYIVVLAASAVTLWPHGEKAVQWFKDAANRPPAAAPAEPKPAATPATGCKCAACACPNDKKDCPKACPQGCLEDKCKDERKKQEENGNVQGVDKFGRPLPR